MSARHDRERVAVRNDLQPAAARDDLERAAARAVAAARREGRVQWLAWRRSRPVADLLDTLDPDAADAFFYAVPGEGLVLAAEGTAVPIEAAGPGRFASLEHALRVLGGDLHLAGAAPPEAGPLLVGGAGFRDDPPGGETWAGFPAARFVLPRALHVQRGERAWTCVAGAVAPHDEPHEVARALEDASLARRAASRPAPSRTDPRRDRCGDTSVRLAPARSAGDHGALVRRALASIRAGEIEKVVVARALDVERALPFDVPALLRTLRALDPTAATFAVKRGDAWLVGATPERLLRRRGRRALVVALAGSAPCGRSPGEHRRLRRELLESKKEQAEHAVVVRALRGALEPLCDPLQVPEAPRVFAAAGVQHLRTPLEGVLHERRGLLELAGRVHPTPAVCGAPAEAALAWLRRHEGLDRGWYTGLVGWVTPDGDGELSAGLRCALLREGQARLFAGGGIVAGSVPELEVAETRLKWNALLPALLEL